MLNYPYYYPQYQQTYPQYSQQPQPQPQNQQPQQIQNGGFLPVRSRQEAMSYPVAPGMSVTFKDESAPYIYTKTKGFNQFDEPVFEVYKLTKEENAPTSSSEAQISTQNNQAENLPSYALKSDFEALQEVVTTLVEDVDILKNPKRTVGKKKEAGTDD